MKKPLTRKSIMAFGKGNDGHKRLTQIGKSTIVIGGTENNHTKLTKRIIQKTK
jgi:hypothetical protein